MTERENEHKGAYPLHPKATTTSTLVSVGMLLLGCTQSNSPANPRERVVVNPSPSVVEPTTSSAQAEPLAQQRVSQESPNTRQNTSQIKRDPAPTATATINWGTLDSKEGKINLRSGPGTVNKAIGYGLNGDQVQIMGSAPDSGGYTWYKVKFPKSSAEGWIAGQLIEIDNSVTSDKPNKPQEQVVEETPCIPTDARCSDFPSSAEAQAALPTNPQLDGDDDGVACESLR